MNKIGSVIQGEWERLRGYAKEDRTPRNLAPALLLLFCNLVFLALDTVTAYTILGFTHVAAYGIIAFLAGCVPLWLAEYGYWSPYANPAQKWISVGAAVVALVEILWCAYLSAQILSNLDLLNLSDNQKTLMNLIIFLSIWQAILAGIYAYCDDELRANQELNRGLASIGRLERKGRRVQEALETEKQVGELENKINHPF